jgi:hypothetical protein
MLYNEYKLVTFSKKNFFLSFFKAAINFEDWILSCYFNSSFSPKAVAFSHSDRAKLLLLLGRIIPCSGWNRHFSLQIPRSEDSWKTRSQLSKYFFRLNQNIQYVQLSSLGSEFSTYRPGSKRTDKICTVAVFGPLHGQYNFISKWSRISSSWFRSPSECFAMLKPMMILWVEAQLSRLHIISMTFAVSVLIAGISHVQTLRFVEDLY